jgi:hypothetical protein
MIVIAVLAFKQGDPIKILTPYDSVGHKCGAMNDTLKLDLTEFKYKLFTKPTDVKNMFSAVCVKECPKKLTTPICHVNSENTECK